MRSRLENSDFQNPQLQWRNKMSAKARRTRDNQIIVNKKIISRNSKPRLDSKKMVTLYACGPLMMNYAEE